MAKVKGRRIIFQNNEEGFADLEEVAKAGGVSKTQAVRDAVRYLAETIRICNDEGYAPKFQKRDNPSKQIEIWLLPYLSSRGIKKQGH